MLLSGLRYRNLFPDSLVVSLASIMNRGRKEAKRWDKGDGGSRGGDPVGTCSNC